MRDDEDRPPTTLGLAKTRLVVEDGELIRRDEAGGVMLRFPLDDVEAVEFVRPFNPFALVALGFGAGLGAIGYFVSDYNVVTVFLYVAGMASVLMSLMGMFNDVVLLRVRGEEIRIESPDVANDIRGFVASLRSMVGGRAG